MQSLFIADASGNEVSENLRSHSHALCNVIHQHFESFSPYSKAFELEYFLFSQLSYFSSTESDFIIFPFIFFSLRIHFTMLQNQPRRYQLSRFSRLISLTESFLDLQHTHFSLLFQLSPTLTTSFRALECKPFNLIPPSIHNKVF